MRRQFFSAALAAIALSAERTKATMAAPVDVNIDPGGYSANDQVRVQLNQVIAALRVLCAKLDLDAGVTDVNYFLLVCDAAAATSPAKVRP